MAYYLYMTRAAHPAKNDEHWITLEEWKTALLSDVTLEHTGAEGVVMFRAAAGEPASHMFWKNGNICCANPDPPTVDKMAALAALLQAKVLGEEAELYENGYDAPKTTQFALFEQRIPNRLRVRFPEKNANIRTARQGEKLIGENRMPIGFPSADRKPSAALLKLLGKTGEQPDGTAPNA